MARETCRNPTWADLIHSKLQSNSHTFKNLAQVESSLSSFRNFSIVQNFLSPQIQAHDNGGSIAVAYFLRRISFIHKTMMLPPAAASSLLSNPPDFNLHLSQSIRQIIVFEIHSKKSHFGCFVRMRHFQQFYTLFQNFF